MMPNIPKTSFIFKNVIQNLPEICAGSIFTWIINLFCLIETVFEIVFSLDIYEQDTK